jgi:hypothetical protein
MTEEEMYEEAIKNDPLRYRLHTLFNQFNGVTQQYILQKYSGIFNYYYEIAPIQILELVEKMERALAKEEERLFELYKDEL